MTVTLLDGDGPAELVAEPPDPVVNQEVNAVVFTTVPLVTVVEMTIGLTTLLLELTAVPDTKVEVGAIRDVFAHDEGDTVDVDTDPLHLVVDELVYAVTLEELSGPELAVPIEEPVLVFVMVMGTIDEPPVEAAVVIQMVDRLKEFVKDHVKLPPLTLTPDLDVEDGLEVEFVAGRGLSVMVTILAVVEIEPVPVPLGLITVPDRVSVRLPVVGNGGLLEADVFVGWLVQENQVELESVTDGRDVPCVPD